MFARTLIAALVVAAPALAQETVNVERFRPGLERGSIVDVESGAVAPHLNYDLGLWMGWGVNPLGPAAAGEPAQVANRVSANLSANLALFDWISLGFDLPFVTHQSRDPSLKRLTSIGLGDLRLAPKIRLLAKETQLVDLAIIPALTLPSAFPKRAFIGEPVQSGLGGFTLAPELALGGLLGDELRYGVNLGARLRDTATGGGVTVGSEAFYKVGAAWRLQERFDFPLELGASIGGESGFDGGLHDVEAMVAGTWEFADRLQIVTGVGAGLVKGHAAPDARFFVGARYAPRVFDQDEDGVLDRDDRCPDTPEDRDHFQDSDGCPEPDNDGDGILDIDDACRGAAEDIDGFEDQDGCPDDDNDGDGIEDVDDECPDQAEDLDSHLDDDGCPELDNDGDGVVDTEDRCRDIAGEPDNDGCPYVDGDGDGAHDGYDVCPATPGETRFSGCPTAVLLQDGKIQLLGTLSMEGASFSVGSAEVLSHLHKLLTEQPTLKVHVTGIMAAPLVAHLVAAGIEAGRLRATPEGPLELTVE